MYHHDWLNHVQFSEIKERLNVPSHKPRKRDAKWITLTVASFIGIFLAQGCFLLKASWKTTVSKTLSPRNPPKISKRNFSFNNFRKWNFYRKFDREWAGNDHFWSYGWSFRNLEKSPKPLVSWNGVPVPSSRYLGKKLPIGDATTRRKKDDATVNITEYVTIKLWY